MHVRTDLVGVVPSIKLIMLTFDSSGFRIDKYYFCVTQPILSDTIYHCVLTKRGCVQCSNVSVLRI